MASNAISGVGTTFKRSDMASVPVFTAIAEINSIDGPNITRDVIDVTSLDSTGGYREFISGFRDGGEVTLEMNFTLDGYDDLKVDLESDSSRDYKITLPDTGNTEFDFTAWVTALGLGIPNDDKITASVTLKITGEITISS